MNNVIKGNLPTGGPLNFLNEAAQTNSRKNTVPVMALVAAHKPNSSEELKELIKNHINQDCKCGLKSSGTVEDFSNNLYNAQFTNDSYKNKYPNEREFTFDECYDFMYSLFCIGPLRALLTENNSKKLLSNILNKENIQHRIEDATEIEDFNYAIDYNIFVILNSKEYKIGIQVKPQSFFKNKFAFNSNNNKHSKCNYPVCYHTYNNHTMKFIYYSTNDIIDFIKNL